MGTDGDARRAPRLGDLVRPAERTETFLFTDVEGSTRLLQRLGERFSDLLLDQRRLLLTAVERHHGIERGTAGDGSFVVFPSAREAVLAAAAAQRALAAHTWPEGEQVRVRMGIHSGESAVTDGIYSGLDVFRAARIAAAGHGGQVLLSQATRQLVERELPDDLSLRDLGSHTLRDLEHPEHISQLVIEGLAAGFPPLRSLGPPLGNLPVSPTSFLGREREVEAVRGLLRDDAVRLLTLTGAAGTGKTRLALESARGAATGFSDGAYFVALASLTDPTGIATRIAEVLALGEHGSLSAREALEAHLRTKRLLLLLDNVEQVISGSRVVSELLTACPDLKVLATSRVALRLSFEREYEVPPLAVPDADHSDPLVDLAAFPAIALFVQRARAVRPDFALSDANAAAVAILCRSLDGLPLAIELAAARVKLLSPQAMVTRLGRRLDLLRGGANDLPERQQTLRQAIAWSYDLLGGDEQTYFRRLACFAGSFDLEAVGIVCNSLGDLALDAEDAVATLVDNSLLRAGDDTTGATRLSMLETIHAFAAERLTESGEEATMRDAHAEYCLALAEEAQPHLTGHLQGVWLVRLDREHDNLRAALAWLESSGAHAVALRLGAALWRFWVSRGMLREGSERLRALLGLSGAQDRSAIRARALHGAGTILAERSEYESARARLDEGLAIWRQLGDREGLTTTLDSLAWTMLTKGDLARAEALATEAVTLHNELGNLRGEAVAHHNLAFIAMQRGRLSDAHRLTELAAELRRRAGDRRGVAYMQVSLAYVEAMQGRLDAAAAHVAAADTVLRELGDRQIGAWAIQVKARVELARGDAGVARRRFAEARELWFESGNMDSYSRVLADIADMELAFGTVEAASRAAEESLSIARGTDGFGAFTPALPVAAAVALARGDVAQARALVNETLDIVATREAPHLEAAALEVLAELAYQEDDLATAVRSAARAAAIRERTEAPLRPDAARRQEVLRQAIRAAMGRQAFEQDWAEATDEGPARPTWLLRRGADAT
jgi:predicted ATPase/class 3 adenylate cyclase